MNETSYSRELVDEKLKVILMSIYEVRDIAIETRDQAKTTNGRVNKLELWKENRNGWITAISGTLVLIIALVSYIFTTQVNALELKENATQQLLASHITK